MDDERVLTVSTVKNLEDLSLVVEKAAAYAGSVGQHPSTVYFPTQYLKLIETTLGNGVKVLDLSLAVIDEIELFDVLFYTSEQAFQENRPFNLVMGRYRKSEVRQVATDSLMRFRVVKIQSLETGYREIVRRKSF